MSGCITVQQCTVKISKQYEKNMVQARHAALHSQEIKIYREEGHMVYYVYGNTDCQAPQGVAKQITKDCQYLLMSLCHIWIVRTNSTSLAKSFLKTIDLAETILGRG